MKHIRRMTRQPEEAIANLALILDFLLFLVQAIPAIIFQKENLLKTRDQ